MEKYIEENGITYELRGDYYYPMLELPEQTHYPIGKYGDLRLDFLKKHRRSTYATLLMNGELRQHRIIEQKAVFNTKKTRADCSSGLSPQNVRIKAH